MGAAAIGVALWRYQMRYNPANPEWLPRDRKSVVLQSVLRYVADQEKASFFPRDTRVFYNI
jgi:hypothetical protein